MIKKFKILNFGKYLYIILSGVMLLSIGLYIDKSNAQSTSSETAVMPSSGTCSFLITLPIPYGADVVKMGGTGFNFIGQITLTSATQGFLSGIIGNAVYRTDNSPTVWDPAFLRNNPVTIVAMNNSNGFIGGYILNVSGPMTMVGKSGNVNLNINVVPSNGGKTLLMQLAGSSAGPGSGVCQF